MFGFPGRVQVGLLFIHIRKNSNEIWLIWKSFFLNTLNKHAPVATIRLKDNRLSYITSDLNKLLRWRDYLEGTTNKAGSKYLRQAFHQVRPKANFELAKTKRQFFTNTTEQQNDNLKGMWKVLKNEIGQGNKRNLIDQIQFNETN